MYIQRDFMTIMNKMLHFFLAIRNRLTNKSKIIVRVAFKKCFSKNVKNKKYPI